MSKFQDENIATLGALAILVLDKREFIDIDSRCLSDMIVHTAEMLETLQFIKRHGSVPINEFETLIQESERLIRKTMMELVVRDDLSYGKLAFLLRVVKGVLPIRVSS